MNTTEELKGSAELRALIRQIEPMDRVYFHQLVRSYNYTEGVRTFLINAGTGAYWLNDVLATEPAITKAVKANGRCECILRVANSIGTVLVADEFDEDRITKVLEPVNLHFKKSFSSVDCPPGDWKINLAYTTVGDKNVILAFLPEED